MQQRIVVALRKCDRVEEIVPYISDVAQRGTRVMFFVHYPVDGLERFIGRYANMETGIHSVVTARRVAESFAMQNQRRRAQERILPACKALQRAGLTIEVDVYAGSMRALIKRYAANDQVKLILMKAKSSNPLVTLIRWTDRLFNGFKPVSYPPVLLLHPQH